MKSLRLLLLLLLPITAFSDDPASRVTVITTTSPAPGHPRYAYLLITQQSLVKNMPGFSDMPKIIVFDGITDPSQEASYNEYKESIKKMIKKNKAFKNTELVFCNEHKHLAGALKEAMKSVKTKYVFVHQDDFLLEKPIDVQGLLDSMDRNPNIKHVRLNSGDNTVYDGSIPPNLRKYNGNSFDTYIDEYIEGGSLIPLLRTFGWSDNDHFARKDYYDEFVFPLIGGRIIPMERAMQPLILDAVFQNPSNHLQYGTYLYGKFFDSPYIRHLDRKSSVW